MRRWLLTAAVAMAVLVGARADAAACCLSSSAFGLGRLASWEHSAVLLGASTSPLVGGWDAQGVWTANRPGIVETESRLQLSALLALHPRLQLSGRVPLVLTTRDLQAQHAQGGGLGDALLAARFEPVFQGEYDFLPEIALTLGATLPSGRAADGSGLASNLGTEVTGRGAWVLTASVTVEVARATWFVQAAGGLAVPLVTTVSDGAKQQFGAGAQGTVGGGVEVLKGLVVSLVARFAYEGPLRAEPRDELTGLPTGGALVPVPESHAYDFGGGPNLSYKLSSHWTLQAGVDFSVPANGLGTNRQGRITPSLGVRFAAF